MLTITWNRGVLWQRGRRWIQSTLDRGTTMRRVIWWPRHGHLSCRVWGDWWLSLSWNGLGA